MDSRSSTEGDVVVVYKPSAQGKTTDQSPLVLVDLHDDCPRCRVPWRDHIQGRCPARVAEAEEFFARAALYGVVSLLIVGLVFPLIALAIKEIK